MHEFQIAMHQLWKYTYRRPAKYTGTQRSARANGEQLGGCLEGINPCTPSPIALHHWHPQLLSLTPPPFVIQMRTSESGRRDADGESTSPRFSIAELFKLLLELAQRHERTYHAIPVYDRPTAHTPVVGVDP